MEQEQTLLDTLKNYLDITWQDEHTDGNTPEGAEDTGTGVQ